MTSTEVEKEIIRADYPKKKKNSFEHTLRKGKSCIINIYRTLTHIRKFKSRAQKFITFNTKQSSCYCCCVNLAVEPSTKTFA